MEYEVVKRFEFADENGEGIILSEGQVVPDKYIQMFGPKITENLINDGYLKSIPVKIENTNGKIKEKQERKPSEKLKETVEQAKKEIEIYEEKMNRTEFRIMIQMGIMECLKEGMSDEEIVEEVMNSKMIENYMRENYVIQKRLSEYILETVESVKEMLKKGKGVNDLNKPKWSIPKKHELNEAINEIVFNPEKKEEIRDSITNTILDVYSLIFTTNVIYIYDDIEGIYKPIEENGMKGIIQYIADKINVKINETDRNEILNNIKAKVYIADVKTNEEISNLIPLKNCYYNIKENKFYKYTPVKIFFSKLNTDYNENIKEPTTFLRFLDDITQGNEKKKNLILDMMTYTLYRTNPYEKMFVLVGSGANGKSTLLKLLEDILGKENVSSRTLHDLAENRFATADLEGKFANLVYELKSQDIKEFDKVKALVSGDTITAERKFAPSFTFKNYAKMIFATNVIPTILDETDAVYRRIILIEFSAKFEKEKRDPFMLEKLLKEKEGIVKLLIQRLPKIIQHGFEYENDIEKIRDRYNLYATSWEKFIDEYIEGNAVSTCVFAKDIYDAYVDFCNKNDISIKLTREQFLKKLGKIQKEAGNMNYIKKKVRTKEIDSDKYKSIEYMIFGIRMLGEYMEHNKKTEVYS